MGNSNSSECVHPLALNILEYCSFEERGRASSLSKKWNELMTSDIAYRWMCVRLVIENKVYSSLKLSPGVSWKNMFLDMFRLRNLWRYVDQIGCRNETMTKVNVYARFRPLDSEKVLIDSKAITLPLHQRLELIKLSCGFKSNREALHLLKEEGSWFGKKWDTLATKENVAGNGKSRLPLKKSSVPLVADIQSVDPGSGRVVIMTPDVGLREFSFDAVLPQSCDQKKVFDVVASGLVTDVMNGINSTAIMYGQTGSGKTYTMFGDSIDFQSISDSVGAREQCGLVYRACDGILHAVESRRRSGIDAELFVTYVEVYGDTVTDLLKFGQRCGHSKVAAQQYVLSGAAEQRVSTMSDICALLQLGEEQKRRAATAMNDRSTRAHGIFILTLKQRDFSSDISMTSKLFLADLGGSEQVKKSQVAPGQTRTYPNLGPSNATEVPEIDNSSVPVFSTGFELGERMRETVYINLGLLALKKCIEALNNGSAYVPYQDSKLTMLLSAGLGTGKISVVICLNSNPSNIGETIATLRFGEKCSHIQTEVRNNATIMEGVLATIDQEIEDLETAIVSKERWEVLEERRKDELAEEGTVEAAVGGMERRVVTVVTGAEVERLRLDELIKRRAELTGSEVIAQAYKTNAIGFGGKYGEMYSYGKKFDANEEERTDNTRFQLKADMAAVPTVVRARGKEWKMGSDLDEDSDKLEEKARKVKRNKLVYSGLS